MNKTDIINLGLFAGGSKKIFAPTDNTKAARYANTVYNFARNLTFELPYDWRWATARSNSLAQLADPPTGFDHQYGPLPDNTIKPIAMIDEDGDAVEYDFQAGLLIVTGDTTTITKTLQTNLDAGEVFIKYIVMIEDVAMYPAWFSQLIALQIALFINEPLKQHTPHFNKVTKMMEAALTLAEEANAKWNVKTGKTTKQSIDRGNTDLIDAAVQTGGTDFARQAIANS